jgi:hypothetical protein
MTSAAIASIQALFFREENFMNGSQLLSRQPHVSSIYHLLDGFPEHKLRHPKNANISYRLRLFYRSLPFPQGKG